MTFLDIRPDAWAMLAVTVLLWATGALLWRPHRRVAAVVLLAGSIVGLAFPHFLASDGFCVAPPGSGCA